MEAKHIEAQVRNKCLSLSFNLNFFLPCYQIDHSSPSNPHIFTPGTLLFEHITTCIHHRSLPSPKTNKKEIPTNSSPCNFTEQPLPFKYLPSRHDFNTMEVRASLVNGPGDMYSAHSARDRAISKAHSQNDEYAPSWIEI